MAQRGRRASSRRRGNATSPGWRSTWTLAGLYADALAVVRSLDMRRPGRPLPEAIVLAPSDLADHAFGPDQLLARIAEALDAEGGRDA